MESLSICADQVARYILLNPDLNKQIDVYLDSMLAAVAAIDIGTMQPFDWLQFQPLVSEGWVGKVQELMNRAREQNIPPAELASLWPGMSALRCQLYFLLLDLKCARVPLSQRLELFQFFVALLAAGAHDDIFGLTSNIVHTKDNVTHILKEKKLSPAAPEIARALGRIYNSLYNLGAGYYVDFYLDYGVENEGPYDVSDTFGPGHTLVIKRAMDMKPTELFPTAVRFLGNDFRFYYVYKDVQYTTNMVSVHCVYGGDPIRGLKWWGLEVDGRMVGASELQSISDGCAAESVAQWQRLKSLNFEEQKLKALEIRCFGMRHLFERVGMDWRPTSPMCEALRGKPFKDNSYWKIPQDRTKANIFFRKLYDPRIDFFPGDSVLAVDCHNDLATSGTVKNTAPPEHSLMSDIIKRADEFARSEMKKYGLPSITTFEAPNQKGLELAKKLGADTEMVQIGTRLMDIKLGEAFSLGKLHKHIEMSVKATRDFLMQFSLPQDVFEKIVNCVEGHHRTKEWTCTEAEICANADCYGFLTVRNWLDLLHSLGANSATFDENLKWAEAKIEEKWKILSLDICKKELEPHYKIIKELLRGAGSSGID